MIVCVDTHYSDSKSRTAVLLFNGWDDELPTKEYVVERAVGEAEYEPGQFYKRELPCILEAIESVQESIEMIVVDGYVQLGDGRPGLGQKLYEALEQEIPVIGVAKNQFHGAHQALPVFRGVSTRPLFVTAIGVDSETAAQSIRQMHGNFRIPSLLKKVDRRSRSGSSN